MAHSSDRAPHGGVRTRPIITVRAPTMFIQGTRQTQTVDAGSYNRYAGGPSIAWRGLAGEIFPFYKDPVSIRLCTA